MLAHINLYNLLFIDIETVPEYSSWQQLSPAMQALWAIKHQTLRAENETPEEGYLKRAGVYAEFAKVVCISIGYFRLEKTTGKKIFRLKSFAGDDESLVLSQFAALLDRSFNDADLYCFCGHNIKEFDVPFLCRRMVIHHINLPNLMDTSGKKPWEVRDVDTLHLWRFGDFKNYTSLKLLAEVLGIPTPKDDIDGKDVCRVYWQEKNLERITTYCQKDVVTVARLLMRLKGEADYLADEDVLLIT